MSPSLRIPLLLIWTFKPAINSLILSHYITESISVQLLLFLLQSCPILLLLLFICLAGFCCWLALLMPCSFMCTYFGILILSLCSPALDLWEVVGRGWDVHSFGDLHVLSLVLRTATNPGPLSNILSACSLSCFSPRSTTHSGSKLTRGRAWCKRASPGSCRLPLQGGFRPFPRHAAIRHPGSRAKLGGSLGTDPVLQAPKPLKKKPNSPRAGDVFRKNNGFRNSYLCGFLL